MKKRIFSILTALYLCLTLLPTVAAAKETAGTATEVKTSDELVGALADHDKAVVKLVEERSRVGLKLSLWRRRPITVRSPAARSRLR